MVLFTHNVKNIRSAAYENGDVDGTCKQALKRRFPLNRNIRSYNIFIN